MTLSRRCAPGRSPATPVPPAVRRTLTSLAFAEWVRAGDAEAEKEFQMAEIKLKTLPHETIRAEFQQRYRYHLERLKSLKYKSLLL